MVTEANVAKRSSIMAHGIAYRMLYETKWEKEYVKAIYCHPAYLTYMESTSCKMLGWMKHSLNQDFQEKYQ